VRSQPYETILIVAHSLGAAVARRAVLDATSSGKLWPGRSKLLLLGPAHLGAIVTGLLQETIDRTGLFGLLLFLLADRQSPVIRDLKVGSPFLTSLLNDTQAALTSASGAPLQAEEVVFGEFENVVTIGNFAGDPHYTIWAGESHCSVCRCDRTMPTVARRL
jgi:pimeloyl-ACP methyl ester carboxylesterase